MGCSLRRERDSGVPSVPTRRPVSANYWPGCNLAATFRSHLSVPFHGLPACVPGLLSTTVSVFLTDRHVLPWEGTCVCSCGLLNSWLGQDLPELVLMGQQRTARLQDIQLQLLAPQQAQVHLSCGRKGLSSLCRGAAAESGTDSPALCQRYSVRKA